MDRRGAAAAAAAAVASKQASKQHPCFMPCLSLRRIRIEEGRAAWGTLWTGEVLTGEDAGMLFIWSDYMDWHVMGMG